MQYARVVSNLFPVKDPVSIFVIVLALIFFSPIVLRRLRLPGMIGLLLAGALLGPNALGVLERDQSFVLFGTVGLLFIMFMAALEIDLAAVKRYRLHSAAFGLTTFMIPQLSGTFFAYAVLDLKVLPSVLLGSVLASHTLLAYPIASRLGIHKGTAVTTAVGGTIITDTLALLVLAVVAGFTRGEVNQAFVWRLLLSTTIYCVVVLVGLPRLARWFFKSVARDGVSEFAFILAVVFGCASLSHLAAIEPIVGAFLAGVALNRLIPHSGTLMSRLQFIGEAIFVPFFLLSVGMLFDVRVFTGGLRSWVVAIGMSALVIGSKYTAAELMRPVLGYSRDEARVMFGLTVAQAAATLAATMVGYELKLFDDTVVNGAILMILVTCVLAPIVVERFGLPLADKQVPTSDDLAGPPQRIIVALAKPQAAHPLLELARHLRDREAQQPVYPLTVVEEGLRAGAEVAEAERTLSRAVVQLSAANIPANPVSRIDLNVPAGILRARRELRATEVIVGWAGRSSTAEMFFGSTVEKLLADPYYTLIVSRLVEAQSTCQRCVLLVPPGVEQEQSFTTLAGLCKRLARELSVKLHVISTHAQEKRVKSRLSAVKPSMALTQETLENWWDVAHRVSPLIKPHDLVILGGMRPSTGALKAGVGDVSMRLVRQLPHNNFLAIFPAHVVDEPEETMQHDALGVVFDHALFNPDSPNLESTVEQLLGSTPGLSISDSASALMTKLIERAVELTPGVVLVHAESPCTKRRVIALALSRTGWTSVLSKSPIYVVIMLVDPVGRDASSHLKNLAALARTFNSPGMVERVRQATDLHDLQSLLNRASKVR